VSYGIPDCAPDKQGPSLLGVAEFEFQGSWFLNPEDQFSSHWCLVLDLADSAAVFQTALQPRLLPVAAPSIQTAKKFAPGVTSEWNPHCLIGLWDFQQRIQGD
jgi:hypothetical protein